MMALAVEAVPKEVVTSSFKGQLADLTMFAAHTFIKYAVPTIVIGAAITKIFGAISGGPKSKGLLQSIFPKSLSTRKLGFDV